MHIHMEINVFVANRSSINLLLLHIVARVLAFDPHCNVRVQSFVAYRNVVDICQLLWIRRRDGQHRLYILLFYSHMVSVTCFAVPVAYRYTEYSGFDAHRNWKRGTLLQIAVMLTWF
jgi:hypothetical protein